MTLPFSFVVMLGIGRIRTWKWICFAVINKVVVCFWFFLNETSPRVSTWTFQATYKWILTLNCCYILHLLWSLSLYLTCDDCKQGDLQPWARRVQGGVTDSQLVQLERGCEPDRPMRICRCAKPLSAIKGAGIGCLPPPLPPHNKTEFKHIRRGPIWVKTHGDR